MSTPFNLVSRDAQQALTEFSMAFDQALTVKDATPWATVYGLANTSKAIRTTYPIPVSAAGYKECKGDDKLRDLFEKSLSMTTKKWYDGVAALASVIEAPDFIGWGTEPQRIAKERTRLPNKLVAAMLHTNPLLDLYKVELPSGTVASTVHLFDDAHPVNVVDDSFRTFDNNHAVTLHTAALNADISAWVSVVKTRFAAKKGPNGELMGLQFNTLFVPPALAEVFKSFFESDTLVITVANAAGTENVGGVPTNNRHKGTVNLVVLDELIDTNMVYPFDANAGIPAWIVQDAGSPEEIRFDKDSDFYKNTYKVGVKYLDEVGVGAALPHAIERVTVTIA
jgi:hypothetical protein